MHLKAATRNRVTNKLFVTTFLVAFSSVALGSVLPCPAHSLDSDTPVRERNEGARAAQE
ncbi:AFL069Cp [Eremothecium gossypii ATCC 10895]|uniref:AFL069Cp n=1 Tax=Eremothecium gossypii (strain ATCC 10895 / CBS 109.51 / FGSC 9923 / NRRL Y-1056) TaxID=284811 RepID=Q754Y0_EREGS|nr:AFL069Cp [Eremothecium gossypii ATCC 10895]AAS53303.1 AFL069Cp [Eremothecium gossypii ATCC 10895]AEY97614.1 FAFL069Cp [Eremothecium gossypii FDAG1]